MAGKPYTFVLNFGYVESASLSFMPWTSLRRFKDAKEALEDLALFFKQMYTSEAETSLKKCCQAMPEGSQFCSKCGTSLGKRELDGERFSDWLFEMSQSDENGIGEYINRDPANRWAYGQLEGMPNQRFVYQAEWVLAAALGYPRDISNTFVTICKRRTKSRSESFYYY